MVSTLPDSAVETDASGVHRPKGRIEYAITALLGLNRRLPHVVTAQRAGRCGTLERYLAGRPLVNVVDKRLGY
jgi:hypothetical protein